MWNLTTHAHPVPVSAHHESESNTNTKPVSDVEIKETCLSQTLATVMGL